MTTAEVVQPAIGSEPNWFVLSGDQAAQELGVDVGNGRSTKEASRRAATYGPNRFNKILHTVGLNLHEWLICIAAALTIVIASEVRKLILRRRWAATEAEAAAPAAGATE